MNLWQNTSRYTEEPRVDERLTDDEEDYDAEEPEKKYHQDLSSRIKEKAYRRLVKTGIPRRPGFYQVKAQWGLPQTPVRLCLQFGLSLGSRIS